MPVSRHAGREMGIREAVQCIITPSTYTVVQGVDARFYPVRFVQVSERSFLELLSLDEVLVSFERYDEAFSFCQAIPGLHQHLLHVPVQSNVQDETR
jgi:hypothetical protein